MSIILDKVNYIYGQGSAYEMYALKDINLEIKDGQFIGIIGHTGSGKSTLIQHLNGLIKPDSGIVMLDGKDIWSKENAKNIRCVRFAVGLCFQYPEYQIFEESVYKEIAFGPKQMGLSPQEIDSRVLESIDYVGLDKKLLTKSPFDMSGGQKRRIAIASIIAMKPEVLVLDEPCAGLDPRGRQLILRMLKDYQSREGNTVLLVSHSMEDVATIADRVLVMNKGKAAMYGTVQQVYSRGSELKDMGLNVPEVTDVFLKLRDMGIECRTDIFTLEQGKAELQRLLAAKEVGA